MIHNVRDELVPRERSAHPDLAEKTQDYVKHCPECIGTKPLPRIGEIKVDIEDLGISFHTSSMDLITGLPQIDRQ